MTSQDVKCQYGLKQWASIVQECGSSGISVKQWCKQNNISEGTYYYWLKKVRAKALEMFPAIALGNDIEPIAPDKTVFTKILYRTTTLIQMLQYL